MKTFFGFIGIIVLSAILGVINTFVVTDIYVVFIKPFIDLKLNFFVVYGILVIKGMIFFKSDKDEKEWSLMAIEIVGYTCGFLVVWMVARLVALVMFNFLIV
jgi:hypothetical protein